MTQMRSSIELGGTGGRGELADGDGESKTLFFFFFSF